MAHVRPPELAQLHHGTFPAYPVCGLKGPLEPNGLRKGCLLPPEAGAAVRGPGVDDDRAPYRWQPGLLWQQCYQINQTKLLIYA